MVAKPSISAFSLKTVTHAVNSYIATISYLHDCWHFLVSSQKVEQGVIPIYLAESIGFVASYILSSYSKVFI